MNWKYTYSSRGSVDVCTLLQASKAKDGDEDVQRKVKEVQKEELEKQNRAQTNSAIGAALGGGARWKNWGKKTSSERLTIQITHTHVLTA